MVVRDVVRVVSVVVVAPGAEEVRRLVRRPSRSRRLVGGFLSVLFALVVAVCACRVILL